MQFILLLVAFLLCAPASVLAEGDSLVFSSGATSIALPGQSVYTGKGLSFGFGSGVYDPSGDCDCMGSWQVQMEYFYTDWLSGSTDVRFFGGDLDRDKMIMYQRYRLNARVHWVHDDLDIFGVSFMGFENTNISEFRKQVAESRPEKKQSHWWEDNQDETEEADSVEVVKNDACGKLFSMDGFTVGLGAGFGYNVVRYVGLTGIVQGEYNFGGDIMLNVSPGVAFNLWAVWPWAQKMLRSVWISFEVGGQRYFNRHVAGWSNVFVLGIQLGV